MINSSDISKQREVFKQEINEIIENHISAKILELTGLFAQRMARRSRATPWYISTILLGILFITPQSLIAVITNDPAQVIGVGLFWSVAALLVMLVIPITYLSLKYILTTIRDHIVDAIEVENDLDNLKPFLSRIGDIRTVLLQALATSLVWSFIAIPTFNFFNKGPIRLSHAFDAWIFGFFAIGLGGHYLLHLMHFPNQMKGYKYKLYPLEPSKSEIIIHVSKIFTRPFLITAAYLATSTLISGIFEVFNWVILIITVLFWVPLLIQFINSQSAIQQIVTSEKWRTLNDFQEKIRQLNANAKNPETIEMVRQLMELHEKVYNSSDVKLKITGIIDFIKQLVLPLLALIASNYKIILGFFNQ